MNTMKGQQKRSRRERINGLKRAFAYNLFYNQGKAPENASLNDFYMAVAHTVRDRMQHLFINSMEGLLKEPACQDRLLPFGRISPWAAPAQQPPLSGTL